MLSIDTNNNSNNLNFCGLSRQLKRSPYADAAKILEKAEKYAKSKGIAGNLPRSWIEKLPAQGRGEKIKDIYQEFGKAMSTIGKGLNWTYYRGENSGLVTKPTQNSIDKAKNIITSVLKKHSIISSEQKVQIENIAEGTYGSAQKLTVNNEEFALKVFVPFEKMLESLTKAFDGDEQKALEHHVLNYLSNCDGIHIEANRAHYLNAKQNPWFNKVFFTDLTNGGMLSKILNNKIQKPTIWKPLKCYGLEADGQELYRNSINNIIYDLGGITLREDNYRLLAENNTARRIYNQFRHTPKDQRESRFDSFSKQYSKRPKSWVEELKSLLYKDFSLGNTPFKPRETNIQA